MTFKIFSNIAKIFSIASWPKTSHILNYILQKLLTTYQSYIQLSHMPPLSTRGAYFESLVSS